MNDDYQSCWLDENNRAIRADRKRTVLLWLAWALAIGCAALLGALIFSWVMIRAADAAQIAPAIMLF